MLRWNDDLQQLWQLERLQRRQHLGVIWQLGQLHRRLYEYLLRILWRVQRRGFRLGHLRLGLLQRFRRLFRLWQPKPLGLVQHLVWKPFEKLHLRPRKLQWLAVPGHQQLHLGQRQRFSKPQLHLLQLEQRQRAGLQVAVELQLGKRQRLPKPKLHVLQLEQRQRLQLSLPLELQLGEHEWLTKPQLHLLQLEQQHRYPLPVYLNVHMGRIEWHSVALSLELHLELRKWNAISLPLKLFVGQQQRNRNATGDQLHLGGEQRHHHPFRVVSAQRRTHRGRLLLRRWKASRVYHVHPGRFALVQRKHSLVHAHLDS